MNKAVKRLYEFGPFVLDPGERLLRHGAARMELPPRAFDTLLALVENNGHLLEKDVLMGTVWGDTVVEESNLTQVIYLLRKALREGEDGARYIETVPKRGYRFVAEVRGFDLEETNGNGVAAALLQSAAHPSNGHDSNPTLPPMDTRGGNDVPASAGKLTAPASPATGPDKARWHSWMQGLIGGVAVIALVAMLQALGWKQRMFGEANAGPIRSVAVLPLQNLSNDPNQEYFVDGMTDELITNLAQIRALKVVSKTSIMQYKNTRTPLPQIGRELGVDAVVEGSVLRSGDRVRITAQLIRTATDRHIWAEAYDGDLKDVLALQARVAEAITNQVKLNLTAEESGRLRRAPAVNPEAFDLYLRGRYAWNQRSVNGFHNAIQYFNRAIEKDPNFALAFSGLADSYTLLALYGEGYPGITQAQAAAEKALQLDDQLAEAHTSLAAVKILHDWDWQGAEQEFQRAINLNPNYAQAHHWYGNLLLAAQGRHEEAMAELRRAQELDPFSLIITADIGFEDYLTGQDDMALEAYQKVLNANPNFVPAHFYLAMLYQHRGQYDLWIKEVTEDDELSGYASLAEHLRQLYARGGMRAVMEETSRAGGATRIAPHKDARADYCSSAVANLVLGKTTAALNGLDDCYRGEALGLIYLKVDPLWSSLRGEPRFQDLLRRLHMQ